MRTTMTTKRLAVKSKSAKHPMERLYHADLPWAELGLDSQAKIQQALQLELSDASEKQVVASLQLLASLKVVFIELQEEFKATLESVLTEVLLHANKDQLFSLLRSMEAMQWKLGGSSELQRVVLYAVNVHISSVRPSELCDLLVLLSRLSIRWSSLHSQLKSALFACIASLSAHDLSSRPEVSSSVMAALGLLGASWSEVPLTTQHGLVASLLCEGQPLSWDCLCDCLLGVRLLQIQLTADDTTAALRGVLLKSLKSGRLLPERSVHSALPQRWVEVMTSLPHFNFTQPQDCLPFSSLLLPLVRHHRLLQGSEVVSLLVSLAALEVGWSDLTVEVQRALVQAVSERASQWDCKMYAEAVFSLSLLLFDLSPIDFAALSEMHSHLLAAFDEIYLFLSRDEMQQCVVYLTLISDLLKEAVGEKVHMLQGWFKRRSSSPSSAPLDFDDKKYLKLNKGLLLQIDQAIKANLTASSNNAALNYSLVQDHSPHWFGVLPADGAVFRSDCSTTSSEGGEVEGLVALVEVDGPHHYIGGGEGGGELTKIRRRRRRKDDLKERLYRIKLPTVPYLRINGSLTTKADRRNGMKRLVGQVLYKR